jgi:hypothetical protein
MAKKMIALVAGMTMVRVLSQVDLDGKTYKVNDVVSLPADKAKMLCDSAQADAEPAAVAYCTDELGAPVQAHVVPDVAQE